MLIGDSILAGVTGIRGVEVDCRRGAKIGYIQDVLCDPEYPTDTYNIIIIHVGTNHVQRESSEDIIKLFCLLLGKLQRKFPLTHVGLSCLLPRPIDELCTRSKTMSLNKGLLHMGEVQGFVVLKTYSPFSRGTWGKRELFKGDLLHPHPVKGVTALTDFFRQQLSESVLMPRIRAAEVRRFAE